MFQSFVLSFSQACRARVEALLLPKQPAEPRENHIDGTTEASATAAAETTVQTDEQEIRVVVIPPACLTATTPISAAATSTRDGSDTTTRAASLPLYGSFWACSASVSYTHLTLPTKRIV